MKSCSLCPGDPGNSSDFSMIVALTVVLGSVLVSLLCYSLLLLLSLLSLLLFNSETAAAVTATSLHGDSAAWNEPLHI